MKVPKISLRACGLVGCCVLIFLLQTLSNNTVSGAQDKTSKGAPPQAAAYKIEVPQGTMDAITAILTRRSIRNYTPRPVPEDVVKLLVTAGMSAPSAFNERSSEFIVINKRKILDEIYRLNPKSLQVKRATVAILVCGNQARERFPGKGYWQLDGSVAAENILIAAHAVGLGAVWTAIYPYPKRMAAVQKLLNLPEKVMPLAIIPIGYPAEQKPRENRYDPARVHDNRW